MPPIRTASTANIPIKPVKTERTHEENQERAYIAASRRSDRSLEARVESARRASEIHKKRTGRSLRVTEQDVINEEMYEEEDDDLPMQYRRLTAHLQTANADFDRRIQAYITNQVAMRAGLAANGQFDPMQAGQFNTAQFFNPISVQSPNHFQSSMMPPQLMHRPSMNYRQSPYPTPGAKPQMHPRSMSIVTPAELPQWAQQQQQSAHNSPIENMRFDHRRMSLPPHALAAQQRQQAEDAANAGVTRVSPPMSRNSSSNNLASGHHAYRQSNSPQQQLTPTSSNGMPSRSATFPSPYAQGNNISGMSSMGMDPLTATLPMESQQLLSSNPAFDQGDAAYGFSQSMQKSQQPFYSYNPNGKPKHPSPPATGLQQTLGTGQMFMGSMAIDTSVGGHDRNTSPNSNAIESSASPYAGYDQGLSFDQSFGMDNPHFQLSRSDSGHVTPHTDAEWLGLLDGPAFDESQAV